MSLCICADSPEPLLLTNVISTKSSCTGAYILIATIATKMASHSSIAKISIYNSAVHLHYAINLLAELSPCIISIQKKSKP